MTPGWVPNSLCDLGQVYFPPWGLVSLLRHPELSLFSANGWAGCLAAADPCVCWLLPLPRTVRDTASIPPGPSGECVFPRLKRSSPWGHRRPSAQAFDSCDSWVLQTLFLPRLAFFRTPEAPGPTSCSAHWPPFSLCSRDGLLSCRVGGWTWGGGGGGTEKEGQWRG